MRTFVVGDVHGRCAQLHNLIGMLPRNADEDTLVFLGDLIDRGADAPGVVEHVFNMCRDNPDRVICLRGNHEQMLIDFIDGFQNIWLTPVTGGERTFEQYTGQPVRVDSEQDLEEMRLAIEQSIPSNQLDFIHQLPLFHEDEYAIYVHAGLDGRKHPRDSSPLALMWSRDMEFYKNYKGKPCVFGHTPTPLLPLRGRLGRHGLYISHSAIGLDTGYNYQSPLSCLSLPDFRLYQTYVDGREETYQITSFIPETIKQMQRKAGVV